MQKHGIHSSDAVFFILNSVMKNKIPAPHVVRGNLFVIVLIC